VVTPHLVASVEVAAPAGTSWLALTDWPRQKDWMLGTEVHVVAGDGRSVGSRLLAVTGLGDAGVSDPMEIVSWEPPVRCVVRHVGRVVRGTGSFTVQTVDPQRSVLVWSEDLELPFGVLGRLGWPVVRPVFALGLRRSLRRFATFAESYEVGAA
jgi:hypothetical protein